MVVCAPNKARAAVTCNQVVSYLTPCISYVQSGGTVPMNCCNGIKTLYGRAQTTQDRQGVCNCLKQVASQVPYTGFNAGLAAGLPSKCGINIPYKISPSTDCQKYVCVFLFILLSFFYIIYIKHIIMYFYILLQGQVRSILLTTGGLVLSAELSGVGVIN